MTSDETYRMVKSVNRGFEIIELLKDRDGAGVTEIANELSLAKGTVHRYLTSLVEDDYLINKNGEYRIGLKFIDLGNYARYRDDISQISKPKVDQLAQETGERAQFILEEYGKGRYVHLETGENAVQTDTHLGKSIYLHTAASGKVILANLPRERVNEIIEKHDLVQRTPNTITDRETLFTELNKVQEQGYALNDEEHIVGLGGAAVPVFDSDDEVVGAIAVSGPANRILKRVESDELLNQLTGTANEIELKIRYNE